MKKPPPVEYLQHLFGEEQFDELVGTATRLLAEEPGNVRAYYWRACAYMRNEKLDAALFDLDRAIDLYDEYADAFSQRGVLYFRQQKLELALGDMDQAVQLEPENPYRYSSRAYIKSAMDDIESAILDYEEAVRLDPDDSIALNNLGLLQEQLGYKSQAQRNFEKADRMIVNDQGELVETAEPAAPFAEPTALSHHPSSLKDIVKGIFTSRAGFREYLGYLKESILGKK